MCLEKKLFFVWCSWRKKKNVICARLGRFVGTTWGMHINTVCDVFSGDRSRFVFPIGRRALIPNTFRAKNSYKQTVMSYKRKKTNDPKHICLRVNTHLSLFTQSEIDCVVILPYQCTNCTFRKGGIKGLRKLAMMQVKRDPHAGTKTVTIRYRCGLGINLGVAPS